MIPGEIQTAAGDIELNVGRETITLRVENIGDRPIQVGSHYHFYETNLGLKFDREKTKGFRLNIISGTAVRFEPGQGREVELVAYAGDRQVYGFRGDWCVTREKIDSVAVAESSCFRHVTLIAPVLVPRCSNVPPVCACWVPTLAFSRFIMDYDSGSRGC